MEPPLVTDRPVTTGRASAALGLISAALLLASLRWAHHWGLSSSAIVASWALTTISAFVLSIHSLRTSRSSPRLAILGLALTFVSLLALALVGALYAAGTDVSGACGGG
jgi:hypothetical protein